MTIFSTIAGIGGNLPGKKVDNSHFANYLDTSDEWIQTRTGIKTRYFAEKGTKVSDVALPAAQDALKMANVKAEDLDLIIFATTTPDRFMPATACLLQQKLKANNAAAMDIQAVCSGFVYGLELADSMIVSTKYKQVLVVGADLYSRILDFQDRATCILFGDGAGAVVVTKSEKAGIAASNIHSDGNYVDLITTNGCIDHGKLVGKSSFEMDGLSVYKIAVKAMESSVEEACQKADIQKSDIKWLVAHQANLRIIDKIAQRLGIDDDKVVRTIADHANTSAASIPLALNSIWTKIKPGDWVIMTAAGGGFTWGSVLWQA